jgi:hypothetical protein
MIKWELNNLNEANLILGCLDQLPHGQVRTLIDSLRKQTLDQVQKQDPPAPPPVRKPGLRIG